MPKEISVENLFAWVPLLMAAELFGFAMTEMGKKHWTASIWFFVSSFAAFALALYLNSEQGLNGLRSIAHSPPPMGWYLIATYILSKILSTVEDYRIKQPDKRRTHLSISIQTFALASMAWCAWYLTSRALLQRPAKYIAASVGGTAAVIPSITSASPPKGPRHLTVGQFENFVYLLSAVEPHRPIEIGCTKQSGDEACDFAAEFVHVFKTAHWTIVGDGWQRFDLPGSKGVLLLFQDPHEWEAGHCFSAQLDAAFARSQIRVWGRGVNPNLPKGYVQLVIAPPE